jgi:hypothetical protein
MPHSRQSVDERTPLVTQHDSTCDAFDVTAQQLCHLMQVRDHATLESLGGVQGIARALKVRPDIGLSCDEDAHSGHPFEARRRAFGTNVSLHT